MLQESDGLRFDQLRYHVAEDRAHSVETFVCVADISQACFIKQNLLDDENGDSLGEFRTCFHDPEAERYDFGGQEEVNDGIIVVLLKLERVSDCSVGAAKLPSP